MIKIRPEQNADHATVRSLHLVSFDGTGEADLVETLRSEGDAEISLVALENDNVIGHVLFSKMSAPFKALALAPVAVLPDFRREGIAQRLIDTGIEQARRERWEGIFVLGDRDYYQRFGFSSAAATNFRSPFAGPYLMVLALQENTLRAQSGEIKHAPAFDQLA